MILIIESGKSWRIEIIMPKLILKEDLEKIPNTITVNLSNWMLNEIDKRADNRSQYIRDAVKEYVGEMSSYYYNKTLGSSIITYHPKNEFSIEDINNICFEKKEISRSELTRNAIRRKLLNEYKIQKPKVIGNDKVVLIPRDDGSYINYRILRRLD